MAQYTFKQQNVNTYREKMYKSLPICENHREIAELPQLVRLKAQTKHKTL